MTEGSRCGEGQNLRHVLSSCTYALAHGRYTWRHNQVLRVLSEAAKAAYAGANGQKLLPQRKVYFLREGCSQNANDWCVAADLEGLKHYPQVLRDSGKRPDLVLSSAVSVTIILAELTVPWEDGLEESNVLKWEKYADLTMDLRDQGYKVRFFAVEV